MITRFGILLNVTRTRGEIEMHERMMEDTNHQVDRMPIPEVFGQPEVCGIPDVVVVIGTVRVHILYWCV